MYSIKDGLLSLWVLVLKVLYIFAKINVHALVGIFLSAERRSQEVESGNQNNRVMDTEGIIGTIKNDVRCWHHIAQCVIFSVPITIVISI